MSDNTIGRIARYQVGDVAITALSDGDIQASPKIIRAPNDQIYSLLASAGLSQAPVISVNAFLIHLSNALVLIDTGAGETMGPSLGLLQKSLHLAKVSPTQVTSVLLTHAHQDHSNGLVDEGGAALFPNAELVVHENELRHWFDDELMDKASPRRRAELFEAPRRQFAPYKTRTRSFMGGPVLPGIEAIPLHGHTPGHSGFIITSGRERLLIWGDTVHLAGIQVPHPQIAVSFDENPEEAIASRLRVLEMAAREKLLVAGMHIDFPGFGVVERAGNSLSFRSLAEQVQT